MDRLASQGICGMMDPLFPGVVVGTHTGTALLFGLPKRQAQYLARGPIEAAGSGIPLYSGDVAIRSNFATLKMEDGRLMVEDRRAGRISDGTEELSLLLRDVDLGDGITASLYPATQHRAVLRLSGPHLSAEISDTDPGTGAGYTAILPSQAKAPNDERAVLTAQAVNKFLQIAHERLSEAPLNVTRQKAGLASANGIITRGAGQLEPLDSIINHYSLRAAVVSGDSTVIGLARLLGFTVFLDPSFTALPDSNMAGKVAAAKDALESHDIVFLHIKGPDISAHDKAPLEKQQVLERVDRELVDLADEGLVITISGDHSTNSATGSHCGDPVPSLIYSPWGRSDSCMEFNESSCMAGGMGRISSTSLLTITLDAMDAMHQFQRIENRLFT
jgi:2,3-bisphosphoglycerate-independent phosphoglycerate mutase